MNAPWSVRHALGLIATAPVLAAIVGSIFNIWYNVSQVEPLLTDDQNRLFQSSVFYYNVVAYPILVGIWVKTVFSMRGTLHAMLNNEPLPADRLALVRAQTINLPWKIGGVVAAGWIFCIPAVLFGLYSSPEPVDNRVLFPLPTSVIIAALITVTLAFFIVELLIERLLFPVMFQDCSPSQTPGAVSLPLNRRNLLNAIAACVCPILSLVLLAFVDPNSVAELNWFMVYVGLVGIALGLFCSWMVSTHVLGPISELTEAAHQVAAGSLDTQISLKRADEFGPLIDEFNRMVNEMKAKRELRQRFGLHVGRRTAEIILAQDPGLTGTEQRITVMFCDIRNFTARCAVTPAHEIVPLLNRFLTMMVDVVENDHHGNVNKFLGDGFMALFGIGESEKTAYRNHGKDAVQAGLDMIEKLNDMNRELDGTDIPPLGIGIGIHTGAAIVGSMGSDDRLEYTAIGDTVNLASRVEGLTKSVGRELLLTTATQAMVAGEFEFEQLAPQPVKGQPEPVAIFSVR